MRRFHLFLLILICAISSSGCGKKSSDNQNAASSKGAPPEFLVGFWIPAEELNRATSTEGRVPLIIEIKPDGSVTKATEDPRDRDDAYPVRIYTNEELVMFSDWQEDKVDDQLNVTSRGPIHDGNNRVRVLTENGQLFFRFLPSASDKTVIDSRKFAKLESEVAERMILSARERVEHPERVVSELNQILGSQPWILQSRREYFGDAIESQKYSEELTNASLSYEDGKLLRKLVFDTTKNLVVLNEEATPVPYKLSGLYFWLEIHDGKDDSDKATRPFGDVLNIDLSKDGEICLNRLDRMIPDHPKKPGKHRFEYCYLKEKQ